VTFALKEFCKSLLRVKGSAVDNADYLKPIPNIVLNSINKPFFKFLEVSALC
jgi:hypothetical protein